MPDTDLRNFAFCDLPPTIFPSSIFGGIAQLVERQLCKLEVRGSNPLASSPESFRGCRAVTLVQADQYKSSSLSTLASQFLFARFPGRRRPSISATLGATLSRKCVQRDSKK